MSDIVLINPRFEVSYWGLEHALPFMGKRANMPVACLPLLAALTPPEHTVTLIDENVEAIDFGAAPRRRRRRHRDERAAVPDEGDPRRAEASGRVHGRRRPLGHPARGLLRRVGRRDLHRRGRGDLAPVPPRVGRGPARAALRAGREVGHDDGARPAVRPPEDAPLPLRQPPVLRGCPFQCEFCDIIVTFGRRPRLKLIGQILAELEALLARGMEIVFIVDDNLIGNKKAIKPVLREVAAWQEARGYPLTFYTEASIDLADDPELIGLMVEANVVSVFVGIESPNEASLRETKKFQNVRAGGTMLEKVHRIQDAGLEVWCGMILGFDNDDETVFDAQREFIREARIVLAMVGMLYAPPKTPLYDRLDREGRLDPEDESEFGTNVIPLRIGREALRDGYVRVINDLYEPDAYFGRLDELYIGGRIDYGRARARYWRRHPWQRLKAQARFAAQAAGLFARLMRGVPEASLRKEYRERVWGLLKARRDPAVILGYVIQCAVHYHAYTMARQIAAGQMRVYNTS